MASWTMPFRPDPVESSRDGGFFWQDIEGPGGAGDMQNDFFGQFVDFDGDGYGIADGFSGIGASMAAPPDALFLLDDEQHRVSGSTGSSGISNSDDFDFMTSTTHIAPTASTTSREVDPRELDLAAGAPGNSQQLEFPGRASVSETDLSRLEGISIHSPQKNGTSTSDPTSPTPPNTTTRGRTKKFVEALSTIRKATTIRKGRKALAEDRPGSPTLDDQQAQTALKPPKQRRSRPRIVTQGELPHSPPLQQPHEGAGHPQFIHGFCHDPFQQPPLSASSAPYFGQPGIDTPLESPAVKSEPGHFPPGMPGSAGMPAWQNPPGGHPHPHPHPQRAMSHHDAALRGDTWGGHGGDFGPGQGQTWWNLDMFNHQGANGEFANHHRNVNMASHAQHSGMPYEYAPMPGPSAAGLMIHMPQPRPPQPTVVNDLTVSAHNYLPPPPPPPPPGTAGAGHKAPTSERPHRPPRAKSSGARHLSCSPVRKQRGPSASPNPGQQPGQPRSRHSSGASVSSVRSASGRLPASMPGTPCSIRKRRSRDASSGAGSLSGESGGSGSISAGGGGGGGLGGGFVNFTPHDGSLLMTGVAPSGSSKTKARREKEAQDRRRRLSEAALKAVAAAGGDVDKLLEQGFAF